MKITIGQIKDMDGKKLEACRVVDTATGEVKNISYNKIREQVVTNKAKQKTGRGNTLPSCKERIAI